jgi:hypothetical protein
LQRVSFTSIAARVLSHVGGEHLAGHVAVELDIAREVDDPHPASAELPLERVFSGEGGLEVEEFGGGLRHVCITREENGRFVAWGEARHTRCIAPSA